MKKHFVWSGLVAAALVFVSGAALSDVSSTAVVRVLHFDIFRQELHALPVAGPPIIYVHTSETVHSPAFLGEGQHPPDPCFDIAATWNGVVAEGAEEGRPNVFAFELLMSLMGAYRCNATVTVGTVGTPTAEGTRAPILNISPFVTAPTGT